ncbi:hypothetical protein CFN78_16870 [Amycolatopsis antarctica]|uniref:Prenyltransferase n=1 Tax=Amycolatopsis antarctica TaxID=1854586 RepID=A0A263D3K0_9PSEU|nr:hypothetical protein CFN78_16870 [Amycolatopsis antarctica]
MDSPDLLLAGEFMCTAARLLERRLAALQAGPATGPGAIAVFDALDGYRNDDGGLGHALEPDVRAAASQPLAVDFGLEAAEQAVRAAWGEPGVRERGLRFATALLPFLDSVAEPGGGLPIVLDTITEAPRADHWGDGDFPAGINPTANIVARLRLLGASSTWLDSADAYCKAGIDRAVGEGTLDGHSLANTLRYLEHTPDREWADAHVRTIAEGLAGMDFFHLHPAEGYGVTPVDLAPLPDDRWRALFPAGAVEAHLDVLAAAQQDDGGWPIAWTAPGPAATLEWRGVVTARAVRASAARR